MAKGFRHSVIRQEHLFPKVPDIYFDRVIKDLWSMCASSAFFRENVRMLNGLHYLVKFNPYGFIDLLEGFFDPYHVRGWGEKSFEYFEKGRKLILPRMDEYFKNKDYMKEQPSVAVSTVK